VISSKTILGLLAFVFITFGLIVWILNRQDTIIERFPPILARLPRLEEERIRKGLLNMIDGLKSLSSPSNLGLAMTLSIITWALFWIFHYLVLIALGVEGHTELNFALSLGSLALVPPSATTLPGIYHASMIFPLSLLGNNDEILATYAVLMNAILMIWVILLGVFGIAKVGFSVRKFFILQ
jgi:uncharacterized protein (TIRG00374 family)